MTFLEPYDGPWSGEEAAHLCRRAGFAVTPMEITAKTDLGLHAAVSSLLDYPAVDIEMEDRTGNLREFPEWLGIKNPENESGLMAWWLYRMVHSRYPLQEQFTLFLHDHFVSSWDKLADGITDNVKDGNDGSLPDDQRCRSGSLPPDPGRKSRIVARLLKEQNILLRSQGMGPFRDLLLKVTRDPAMLIYLDNWVNYKDRPQENYAREVMELFSMGVGNYTENDVQEVAKALTGESLKPDCELDYPYSYFFYAPQHSRVTKTVFGASFNESGRGKDTEKVIDLILRQVSRSGVTPAHAHLPSTALYMSWKFINWFVSEEIAINHPAVEELAEIFFENQPNGINYDIRETLRILLSSQFFFDTAYRWAMIKHPADYVVTALRVLDLDEIDYRGAAEAMNDMGMKLFSPPNVAGWDHGRSWINSTNLITRFNYADRLSKKTILNRKVAHKLLTEGHVKNETDHDGLIEYFRARLLQQRLKENEIDIFQRFLSDITGGQDLFRRKVSGVAHLMMTMPKYQVK